MKCPLCGCQDFFVKNPDDEFDTREFSVAGGKVKFSAGVEGEPVPEIREAAEAFCNKCTWHGEFQQLKKG